MSQVVSTFQSAVRTAIGAPAHTVLVFLTTLLGVVLGGVLGFIPLVGPLVNGMVIAPLLLVAVVGSAHAIRSGNGAFGGASDAVKRAGVSVMGAYALLTGVYIGISVVLTLFIAVLAFAMGMGGGMQSGSGLSAMTGALGVVSIVLFLAFIVVLLAVAMAVQFVAPAAVVVGTGAVDSLKTSYRFFRRNLLGVTGFSLVLAGIGVAAILAVGMLYAIGYAIDPAVGLVFAAVGYLVALAAAGSISSIYQVGYFEAVVESADLPEGHEPDSGESDTGDFVVGDVSRKDAAGNREPDQDRHSETSQERDSEPDSGPDTGGFHVEMAGEDDGTDKDENSADETGWGTDSGNDGT